LHGGSIEAASDGIGRGATFIVRLPLAGGAPRASPSRALPALGRAQHRVLVVDDNADAAETLRMVLELQGLVVEVVEDGPAALQRMESFAPDVLLLDLGLPGMNGLQVAERVRATPRGPEVLIVAVTGWGQEEDRERTVAAFDAHLTKPVDTQRLLALISDSHGAEAPARG
jgi:two-component system, chemotaxis family, CheB/CheR fusion protein